MNYEYATIEWAWDASAIRVNLPSGREKMKDGSYGEVVETLTKLGGKGWEVATTCAAGNWIFWTLKRPSDDFDDYEVWD